MKKAAIFIIAAVFVLLPVSEPVSADEDSNLTESSEQEIAGFVPVGTVTIIGLKKAKALFDDGVMFVDIRPLKKANLGKITGAAVVNLQDEEQQELFKAEVGSDQNVVFYGGKTDANAVYKIVKMVHGWGYDGLFFFKDGVEAWQAAKYPLKVKQ